MVKFLFQIVIEILLFVLLFFNVFVLKTPSLGWTLIYIITFLMLMLFLVVKYRKPYKTKNNDVLYIIGLVGLAYLGSIYFIGLFSGYSSNSLAVYKGHVSFWYVFMTLFGIILMEVLRYVLSLVNIRDKKKRFILNLLTMGNLVLIDIVVTSSVVSINSGVDFFRFICVVLLQSIAKNILLSYINKLYGYKLCIVYRLLTEVYVFIAPVIPDINEFLKAILAVLFPYITYLLIQSIQTKKVKRVAKQNKSQLNLWNAVMVVLLAMLVMLISCNFRYGLIAIGSGSMTGTIDKGDAVLYHRLKEEESVQEGEIIVFKKNNMMIVHRVIEAIDDYKGEMTYRTKGDANEKADSWIVTRDEIVGIVNNKILWVAWPSVLINEWL